MRRISPSVVNSTRPYSINKIGGRDYVKESLSLIKFEETTTSTGKRKLVGTSSDPKRPYRSFAYVGPEGLIDAMVAMANEFADEYFF